MQTTKNIGALHCDQPPLYTFPPLYTQKPAARRVFVFYSMLCAKNAADPANPGRWDIRGRPLLFCSAEK
jgi:hypothetical protein